MASTDLSEGPAGQVTLLIAAVAGVLVAGYWVVDRTRLDLLTGRQARGAAHGRHSGLVSGDQG